MSDEQPTSDVMSRTREFAKRHRRALTILGAFLALLGLRSYVGHKAKKARIRGYRDGYRDGWSDNEARDAALVAGEGHAPASEPEGEAEGVAREEASA
jgi:hypothetical protein